MGDHHIVGVSGKGQPVAEGRIIDKLGIGAVQDHDHVARQIGVQALHLRQGQDGSCGIAGIVQEDDLGALVHQGQHIVDHHAQVGHVGEPNLGLGRAGEDGVGGKAVFALDDVVAGLHIDLDQVLEHLVRPAAEHQPLRLQADLGQQLPVPLDAAPRPQVSLKDLAAAKGLA